MEVELSSIPTPSQPDKELVAAVSLPEPFEPVGLVKVYPDVCDTLLDPLPETVQSSLDPSQAIGPYLTSAGIDKTSFSSGCTDLPTITELKNGHVLELYYYFTKTLEKTLKEFAQYLITMSCHTEVAVEKISGYVSMLVRQRRTVRGRKTALDLFLNAEFRFVRSLKERHYDIPRKKTLMKKWISSKVIKKRLQVAKAHSPGKRRLIKKEKNTRKLRKLRAAAAHPSVFEGTALQSEVLEESHHKENQRSPVLEKLASIDAVNGMGGFWRTPAIIEREFLQLQDKDDNTIKHAISAQLQFAHEVLQVTGPEKGISQLTKMLNGEKTDFTKEELKAQLIEVVQELYQPTSEVGGNQSVTSETLSYEALEDSEESEESEEEFEGKCYIKKRQVMQKIQAGAVERALQSKQQHLESLLQNPSLLVGKTIKLACRYGSETLPSWCKGTVIGIAKEVEDSLFTEFCVDFTQDNDQNRMEWIYILRLIEDLQNKELIIDEY